MLEFVSDVIYYILAGLLMIWIPIMLVTAFLALLKVQNIFIDIGASAFRDLKRDDEIFTRSDDFHKRR